MFRRIIASISLACVLFTLAACQPEAPKEAPAAMAPTNPTDTAGWRKYVQEVAKTYAPGDKSQRFYATYVEHDQDVEKNKRVVDNIKNQIAPGLAEGTLLLYASPDSSIMADIIVEAFAEPRANALSTTTVIFIGKPQDQERVRAAVGAWGAGFKFHEAK